MTRPDSASFERSRKDYWWQGVAAIRPCRDNLETEDNFGFSGHY